MADTTVLLVRFAQDEVMVNANASALGSLGQFTAVVRAALLLDDSSLLKFYILMPAMSLAGANEIELEDAADLSTLRSGDVVIVRQTGTAKVPGRPTPPPSTSSNLSARLEAAASKRGAAGGGASALLGGTRTPSQLSRSHSMVLPAGSLVGVGGGAAGARPVVSRAGLGLGGGDSPASPAPRSPLSSLSRLDLDLGSEPATPPPPQPGPRTRGGGGAAAADAASPSHPAAAGAATALLPRLEEPTAALAELGLTIDEAAGRLLYCPRPGPAGKAPTADPAAAGRRGSTLLPSASSSSSGSSPGGGAGGAPRRVTPGDFGLLLLQAPAASPAAQGSGSPSTAPGSPSGPTLAPLAGDVAAAVAGLVQARLVRECGLVAGRVQGAGPGSGELLLLSPNLATAETVFLFCPPDGTPAGLWSLPVVLLAGLAEGSVAVYLHALRSGTGGAGAPGPAEDGWAGNPVGVVLASGVVSGGEGSGPGPAGQRHAAMAALYRGLLCPPPGPGSPSGPPPGLVFVTSGSGAGAALSLLTDPELGAAVRARTRGLALIEPPMSPRVVAAAAALASSPGGAGDGGARASAGLLRVLLRQRAFAWYAEVKEDAPPLNGSAPPQRLDISLNALGRPFFSEDNGCFVQSSALRVAGVAPGPAPRFAPGPSPAARELAAGFAPVAAAGPVLSFAAFLITSGPGASAAEYAASFATKALPVITVTRGAGADPLGPSPPAPSFYAQPEAGGEAEEREGAPLLPPPPSAGPSRATALLRSAGGGDSGAGTGLLASASPAPASEAKRMPAAATTPTAAPTAAAGAGLVPQSRRSSAPSAPAPGPPAFVHPAPAPHEWAGPKAATLERLQWLFLDAFAPDGGSAWKPAPGPPTNGVRTYASQTLPSDGGEPYVGARGDSILPFPPAEVLRTLVEDADATRNELDAQLDKAFLLGPMLTPQLLLQRLAFKGVFPTDPRDFVVLSGWEADEAGTVYIFARSVPHGPTPPQKGFVRGSLDIGGWVVSPLSAAEFGVLAAGGLGPKGLPPPSGTGPAAACKVTYLFRTSIGGNIPKMIVKSVTAAQAQAPATLGKLMAKRRAAGAGAGRAWALGDPDGGVRNLLPSGAAAPVGGLLPAGAPGPSAGAPAGEGEGEEGGTVAVGQVVEAQAAAAAPPAEEEAGEAAAPAAAAAATVAAPSPAPFPFPPLELTGVWKLDRSRSDSLQPMLASMGIGMILRKMADSLEIVTTISHPPPGEGEGAPAPTSPPPGLLPSTTPRVATEDASRFGKALTTLECDWEWHEIKGQDGKKVTYRAFALAGVDGVPPDSTPDDTVAAYRAAPRPPPLPAYPRFGPGSGVLLSESVLPDGLGTTRDERWMESPSVLRLTTVYVRGGAVKNRLVRYLKREGPVPEVFSLPPFVPPAEAVAVVEGAAGEGVAPLAVGDDLGGPEEEGQEEEEERKPLLPPTPAAAATAAAAAPTQPVLAASAPKATAPARPPAPAPAPPAPAPPAPAPPATAPATAPFSGPGAGGVAVTPVPPPPAPASPWSAALWQPDSEGSRGGGCGVCGVPLPRVHHCRVCGRCVCDTHSRARLPPAHLPPALLAAAGLTASAPVRTCDTCAVPVVLALSPLTTLGGRVMITGGNLGASPAATSVRIIDPASGAPSRPLPPASVSFPSPHTALSVSLPPGVGPLLLSISVGGRERVVEVRRAPPTLTGLETGEATALGSRPGPGPSAGPGAPGAWVDTDGGSVVLRGSNLGDSGAVGRGAVCVSVNGLPAVVERVVSPHTALQVAFPPGCGGCDVNSVTVTVGGLVAQGALPFAYAPPAVFCARVAVELGGGPAATDAAGEPFLYVSGANLGGANAPVSVTVAGVPCPGAVHVLPHCKLRVHLPPAALAAAASSSRYSGRGGGGGGGPRVHPADVVVTVGGQRSG